MELTPRTAGDGPAATRRRRPVLVYVVIAAVLVALGVVVWQGLSNATLYFYTADRAVAERDALADRRFRIEGEVVGGTITADGEVVRFTITNRDVDVDVVHRGDPPEMFQPGIPVVLEGRWADAPAEHFDSDRMMIRHSSEYQEENPDRVEDYVGEQGDEQEPATP